MATQSIIVYRSPAEAALWESGLLFPLMTSIFVYFVSAWAFIVIIEKLTKRRGPFSMNAGRISMVLAALPAIAIFHHLASGVI